MKKKIIIIVAIVVLLGVAGMIIPSLKGGEEKSKVRLTSITNENITENLVYQGAVVSEKTMGLFKKVPLVVDQILVKPGSIVKKGEELIRFQTIEDNRGGKIALELDRKELEVETLKRQLVELERRKDVVRFELGNANKVARTMKKLLKEDGVSSIEANRYITTAALKNLEYNNVKKDIALTSGELKIRRKELREMKREIKRKFIAPEDGIVMEIYAQEGMANLPSKPLLKLASLKDGLNVEVLIPSYQAEGVSLGSNVDVRFKTSTDEKRYKGKISNISKVAISVRKGKKEEKFVTAIVKLGSYKGLLPGSNVEVEISGKELNGLNVVDAFSVVEENGNYYVYKVEDGRAVKTKVEVGVKTLSKYQILDQPLGTKVIVNPFKVRDNQVVKLLGE